MKHDVVAWPGVVPRPECIWRDSATLHVLGSLSGEQSQSFLEHVAAGCGACAGELEIAEAAVAAVDLAVERDLAERRDARGEKLEPRPEVREKLLGRIANGARGSEPVDRTWQRWRESDVAKAGALGPGILDVRGEDGAWESIGRPGIEVKRLAVDAARRNVTMLVRMAPGASYPPHRHADGEQCYVITGDLEVGGRALRAGDFQVAAAGSVHEVQSTRNGCTLLILSSQDDVLV